MPAILAELIDWNSAGEAPGGGGVAMVEECDPPTPAGTTAP